MRCGWIIAGTAALGGLTVALWGCMIGMDLFSSDFLNRAGMDANAIKPSSGTVVVLFTNHSQSSATFYAYVVPDLSNRTLNLRNFSVQVEAGKNDNEVLTCPVGEVGLGKVGADGNSSSTVAVVLAADTGATTGGTTAGTGSTVDYTGAPAQSPRDFACGDLISVELSEDGTVVIMQIVPS